MKFLEIMSMFIVVLNIDVGRSNCTPQVYISTVQTLELIGAWVIYLGIILCT